MKKLRLGIVGMGIMGTNHARTIVDGKTPAVELTAVSDAHAATLDKAAAAFPGAKPFADYKELIASGVCDAILIATPHYGHPPIAIAAMEGGLDVLVEKPVAVDTLAAREMMAAADKTGRVYAVMFNERTNPCYKKVKELIASGELGEFTRVTWIVTHWYRTQHYYDMGDWRGTWGGEGGGVLMNQCPHQLDLLTWICGLPETVRADCHIARHHDIEVEDDVTAVMTWKNGASGVFIANTAEAPGTNRLEIAGTRGRIIVEEDKLTFHQLRVDTTKHLKAAKTGFERPECWEVKVPVTGAYDRHAGIMNAFADKILNGGKLLADGSEGINGLMLCNAMYLSSWTGDTVVLPIDDKKFRAKLQEKIDASKYKG